MQAPLRGLTHPLETGDSTRKLGFAYDGFGNKTQQTVTKGSAPSHSFSVNSATNRLTHWSTSVDANGKVLSAHPGRIADIGNPISPTADLAGV